MHTLSLKVANIGAKGHLRYGWMTQFLYTCGMDNGYCIYFGEKPYYITSQMNEQLLALTDWGGTILVNQPTPAAVVQAIHDLERTDAEAAIILTNRLEYYWQIFKEQFTLIDAAGGLVQDEAGRTLFIYRRGMWDLPKGKLDPGESMEQCALREVKEETGAANLHLKGLAGITYHVYPLKGKNILKRSTWYYLQSQGPQNLQPQAEEDILELRWVSPQDWPAIKPLTYPSIRALLNSPVAAL